MNILTVNKLRFLNNRDLYFILQEVDMQGKKAIVISVPVPQIKAYQKIQTRLVRELEKKFNGKPVVFIAQVRNCYKILYEFPLFTNNVILLV